MLKLNNLAGFGVRRAAAAGVTTLSFIASTTSELSTITAPASIDAGDLLLLVQSSITDPAAVTPTDFTNILDSGLEAGRTLWDYKICDGTEDSTTITGMNDSFDDKILLQFRGDVPITAVTAQDITSEFTANNPAAQTCNASGGASPLIAVGSFFSSSSVGTRSFTPAADAEINSSSYHYAKYKIYNSSPADITIDMDDEGGANVLCSGYLEIS